MLKCKIIVIGHMPYNLNLKRIENWASKIFSVNGPIERFTLEIDSDGPGWEYSDSSISKIVPKFDEDFLLAIVNVPLEAGYYARRINRNTAVITMYQMQEILNYHNIPLENIIFRVLYAYSLIHYSQGYLPNISETGTNSFTHDETRSCIYDMTGLKEEIVYSCSSPQLCDSCSEKLLKKRVSKDKIESTKKELRRIHKTLFFRITDYIKIHPIIAFIISSAFAIVLGTVGSLLASTISK